MPNRIFTSVDLTAWIYGTIEKHRDGAPWRSAWVDTYWAIGGRSKSSGEKGCPMMAAKTLFEMGRIKNSGLPFTDRALAELWSLSRNGTYAILATRMLRARPLLSKASLWTEIQHAVRREIGEEPARTNQGGPTLAYQLWHLGLIVEESA